MKCSFFGFAQEENRNIKGLETFWVISRVCVVILVNHPYYIPHRLYSSDVCLIVL